MRVLPGAKAGPRGSLQFSAAAQGAESSQNCTYLFRGLRPEAGNAGSRGDLSHILLEVLELQLRSAHVRPPKPSPKA